jgi:hypothetical protein
MKKDGKGVLVKRYRASQDILNKMKEREEKQSEALSEFKGLVNSFDGPFWELMHKRLSSRADGYAKRREEKFFDLNELELKILKAREEELRFVADAPKDIVESYKSMVKENSELKEEIRSYDRRIRKGL